MNDAQHAAYLADSDRYLALVQRLKRRYTIYDSDGRPWLYTSIGAKPTRYVILCRLAWDRYVAPHCS